MDTGFSSLLGNVALQYPIHGGDVIVYDLTTGRWVNEPMIVANISDLRVSTGTITPNAINILSKGAAIILPNSDLAADEMWVVERLVWGFTESTLTPFVNGSNVALYYVDTTSTPGKVTKLAYASNATPPSTIINYSQVMLNGTIAPLTTGASVNVNQTGVALMVDGSDFVGGSANIQYTIWYTKATIPVWG